MVKKSYTPRRQDIIRVDLNPTKGHEQANIRPVLVLSPESYNKKTGLMVVCPLTTKIKGYPFEVSLNDADESSVILADQVRTLDWRVRKVTFVRKAPSLVLRETQEKIALLIL